MNLLQWIGEIVGVSYIAKELDKLTKESGKGSWRFHHSIQGDKLEVWTYVYGGAKTPEELEKITKFNVNLPERVIEMPVPPWVAISYVDDGETITSPEEFLRIRKAQWHNYKMEVDAAISIAENAMFED